MPHSKTLQPRKRAKIQIKASATNEEPEDVREAPVSKISKVVDVVDIHDDITGSVEEKPEVDPLAPDEDSEDSAAEEVLDDDEVNPFGDKWEV